MTVEHDRVANTPRDLELMTAVHCWSAAVIVTDAVHLVSV